MTFVGAATAFGMQLASSSADVSHRENEDLPVAHSTGSGHRRDLFDNLIETTFGNPALNLDLGQERKGTILFRRGIEVAFLTAVPFHLTHHQCLDRQTGEYFKYTLCQKRLDDGDDLPHDATPFHCSLLRRAPQA
jgi:hypothetical protein